MLNASRDGSGVGAGGGGGVYECTTHSVRQSPYDTSTLCPYHTLQHNHRLMHHHQQHDRTSTAEYERTAQLPRTSTAAASYDYEKPSIVRDCEGDGGHLTDHDLDYSFQGHHHVSRSYPQQHQPPRQQQMRDVKLFSCIDDVIAQNEANDAVVK